MAQLKRLQLGLIILHCSLRLVAATCPCCTFELQSPYVLYGVRVESNASSLQLSAASEFACAMLCVGANVVQLEPCFAAQFNPSSRLCKLVTQSSPMHLVNDLTTVTYIYIPQPNLFLPLSQTCYTSLTDNYGTGGKSVKVSIPTLITKLSSPYAYLNNTIVFQPSVAFPAVPEVTVTDVSPGRSLDIFNGSFTTAFFLKIYSLAQDIPVIEFLGSAAGQLCVAARISCNGTCLVLLANSNCSCVTPFETFKVSAQFTTHWTHVAIAQNSATKLTTYYYNGVPFFKSNYSIPRPIQTSIARMRIGTSECNGYTNGMNSFNGSIACIQLYKTALTDVQILTLYKQCYASSG